jgi:hypothetical protein
MSNPVTHASIGLMAKHKTPTAPLWLLLLATQVPDLLFFLFEALGIEYQAETKISLSQGVTYLSQPYYAWSHGLVPCLAWSVLAALLVYPFFRDRWTSLVVGLLVFSHWLLDAIVYNNLSILPGYSRTIGLGLINTGPGFIVGSILEVGWIVVGLFVYFRNRKQNAGAAAQASS